MRNVLELEWTCLCTGLWRAWEPWHPLPGVQELEADYGSAPAVSRESSGLPVENKGQVSHR